MSTLTLGIVVIIYMFILAWLGYIGPHIPAIIGIAL